jgi:hypothetical protein
MADADRPSDSFSLLVEIENVEKKTKSGPAKLKRAKRNHVQKTYAGLVDIISGAKLHITRKLVGRQALSVRRPAKKKHKNIYS